MLSHAQTPASTTVSVFPVSLFPLFGPDTGGGAGQDAPLARLKMTALRSGIPFGKGGERYPVFPDDDPQPVGERYPWFPDEDGDKGGKRATMHVRLLNGIGGVQ